MPWSASKGNFVRLGAARGLIITVEHTARGIMMGTNVTFRADSIMVS